MRILAKLPRLSGSSSFFLKTSFGNECFKATLARASSTAALGKRLPLEHSQSVDDPNYDSIVIVGNDLEKDLDTCQLANRFQDLKNIKNNHKDFEKDITFTISNNKRVIYTPTGPLNRDYDDVRRISDAVYAGVKKAIKTGSKKPLLVNAVTGKFKLADHVTVLSALEASYKPLEVREFKQTPDELLQIEKLGFWHSDSAKAAKLLEQVNGLEMGRIVARDIGGSDPERMSSSKVQEYVESIFGSTDIKVSVIQGQDEFLKNYPCFAAVNRAANVTPRHQGRIIKLEYSPSGPINQSLFLVGKGITYDTGGADIKHGGNMAGMHRDKCGAAFVAGFFKTLSILKPQGIKVYGTLCLARNSIGEECYVSDEILISRSNKRIRVGNTDAEGRLAICDSLCEAKELAVKETNPKIFTIATLTGHVLRCYGPNYTGIMSNGPARNEEIDRKLQQAGDSIGDPYEISTIRKEDYKSHSGKSEYEDIMQAYSKPSAVSARGHQGPAAFLIMASGLDKHGVDSNQPLPYSHIDIAGSCGKFPGIPSAVPLPSFFTEYILPRI